MSKPGSATLVTRKETRLFQQEKISIQNRTAHNSNALLASNKTRCIIISTVSIFVIL